MYAHIYICKNVLTFLANWQLLFIFDRKYKLGTCLVKENIFLLHPFFIAIVIVSQFSQHREQLCSS